MVSNSEFHIFRDSQRWLRAGEVVARLRNELAQISSSPKSEELVFLLVLAGELECALADAGVAGMDAATASHVTNLLAEAAVECDAGRPRTGHLVAERSVALLNHIEYCGAVSISAPEGFAYYALHPIDYADLVMRLKLSAPQAFIIGIRSIGTTLSAVVRAKLRQCGVKAHRTTVRPSGHPYDRRCDLKPSQQRAIALASPGGAEFIVVDEGPGRSGSSLLSVAEALEREGVPAGRILLAGSHEPDVNTLCAFNAAQRWSRYRHAATGMTRRLPADADVYAGGEWRRAWIVPDEAWPAVWPQMERLKYLSSRRRELLTFEGHGPYGAAACQRNRQLADSNFGPLYFGQKAGFGRHALPPGRVLRQSDVSPELLAHIAEYCAWRARAFPASGVEGSALEAMVKTNFVRGFGGGIDGLHLSAERPAICDNRMAPTHWWLCDTGGWLKLDAAIHGDDHFFPGPCDIAWDLAGVIVEWELSASATAFLLAQYRRASGDDVAQRIRNYEVAYAIFRMAWSKMAAASVSVGEEQLRLLNDYRRYTRLARSLIGCRTPQSPRPQAAARLREARETSAAPTLP